MSQSRTLVLALGFGAVCLFAARDTGTTLQAQAKPGNPITGVGMPNPNPVVTKNWGELPAGRKWGTSAGIDIDPIDGNIWAY